MEEQKKSNGGLIAIIIIVCVFVFVILPIIVVGFFYLSWGTIRKSVNEQWNQMVEEEINNNQIIEEPIINSSATSLPMTEDGKTIIYFFRGEGCPHCTEAEAWFESIKSEYGNMFIVKNYEVWYNQENATYMEEVAESRDETVMGVPYIIVGNKSWNGFTETYENEIISEIKRVYELY